MQVQLDIDSARSNSMVLSRVINVKDHRPHVVQVFFKSRFRTLYREMEFVIRCFFVLQRVAEPSW